jgi:hypothetical protein
LDVVTNVGTSPGMTTGSLASATLDAGIVVVVTGLVVVVVGGFVVVVPGLVVVVTGLVVVVTGFVVVVTGFVVVVVGGFVVVVPGFVVVVTGFVVVVVGGTLCAVTVTLPGALVMKGTGSPAVQPNWSTSTVLSVVRKATVPVRPVTRMLARPFAAVTPVNAERSVTTYGRHAA